MRGRDPFQDSILRMKTSLSLIQNHHQYPSPTIAYFMNVIITIALLLIIFIFSMKELDKSRMLLKTGSFQSHFLQLH